MKKSKIIAPALGVLVLSTAASISGTVAWFTANRTVTVSGLQVSAQASSDLYIANSTYTAGTRTWADAPSLDTIATGKATDVAAITNNGASTLIPSSSSDYGTWYYLADQTHIATGGGYFGGSGSGAAPVSGDLSSLTHANPEPEHFNEYVHVSRCFVALKEAGDAASKGNLSVTAAITAETSADDLLNVVRCAVVVTGGSNALFSADADNETKPIASSTSIAANAVTSLDGSALDEASGVVKTGFMSNTVYTVTIFTWFEGQDAACVNANSIDSGNYNVALKFTLAPAA